MDGLIIKKEWLDKIFDEYKNIEIRGSNCKKRGKIALIQSGSGMIVGETIIHDSFMFKNEYDFNHLKDLHFFNGKMPYKKTWGWCFYSSNTKRYDKPIPYNHPQGAVIWVKDVL